MKITFKESGDFEVEHRDDDPARGREAATEKAAVRYGGQPVYFDALAHGAFSRFEQSPDYDVSKSQIRKSLDTLRQFLDRKRDPANQAASAQIAEFGNRVESGSSGFFSARVSLAHSMGKEALEQLAFSVENPDIREDRREAALKNLAPELIACADGAIDQLVRRARLLELESAGGLKFNARSEWEKMLSQSILAFAQERFGLRQNYRNNEIHYHNGFWNYLAPRYGMPESADEFIPSLALTDADKQACERHVTEQVTPGRLVHQVAENCLSEIRGRFHALIDRALSTDEVFAFYPEYENWALTELHERFGVVPPGALFVSADDERGETVYRMISDPALLMPSIGENLVASGLLGAFPVRVVASKAHEQVVQLAYQSFLVRDTEAQQNRSLMLRDLAGLADTLNPRMALAALGNTPKEELARLPADRMIDLLECERAALPWISLLSEPALRDYRRGRPDAERALFARVPEKMLALDGTRQELALLAAAKAGDEPLAAYLAGGFPAVRAFDGQGNAALHYAAAQGMSSVIERLAGKLDFNLRNWDHRTPLMMAAQSGHAQAVLALVARGAEVEAARADGRTALLMAAASGRVQAVRALLDSGAGLKRADAQGRTALLIAAAYDKRDVMKTLIERGADMTRTDMHGWSVLLIAAAHGSDDAVAELAERRVDLEQTTSAGLTALMLAARYGQAATVSALAARHVDVNRATVHGVTALICAAQFGHASAIEAVVDGGADIDLATPQGMTAAMFAARNGHAAALEKLAERGADLERVDQGGATALIHAVSEGSAQVVQVLALRVKLDHAGLDGMTALMRAARRGDSAIVALLLAAGADARRVDHKGVDAVMVAALHDRSAVIEALAAHGVELDRTNVDDQSALMLAASRNCVDAVRALLSNGVDMERGDGHGRSALMIAADNGHAEALKALLLAGADVARTDVHGFTALMIATRCDDVDAVAVLLEHHADIEYADSRGTTALMLAAQDGNPDVLEALLVGRADIDRRDEQGMTALMHAAREGRSEAVALLLDYAADMHVVDRDGRSALAHADRRGHDEVAQMLRRNGAEEPASSAGSESPGESESGSSASSSAEPSAKRRRF